ncbi:ligand-gated ion channel [Rhizobium alvei]|uniref:Neurotransmitter-gated ion-channel ligand-binding protein n=1 Tax=Rhizobium alvei TaxID=1132659 RepID=A0ABT8YGZ4_9HYPH|nr:neurotransmitter-gated ion-channel ligand-binding protein [Rhizobium alvei]MDO6962677.1 neurotransmitter-gated ion-channel ligand-binding protein [Rhizobium alvei]
MAVLFLFIAIAGRNPSVAAESAPAAAIPVGIHLPVKVHLSARILNIARLSETDSEVTARIEFTYRWQDPARAFKPLDTGTYRQDFYGTEAEQALSHGWAPGFVVGNQISEPRSQTIALSVQADGTVTMIRQIEADYRVAIDLSSFPFDSQKLSFQISTPRYDASQVIFAIDDRDRELSGIAQSLSASDWRSGDLTFQLSQTYGWNAKPFSNVTVTAEVSRTWPRYLLRIFVPFAAVVSVSIFILWAPDRMKVDPAGIIYSALLALAALSFSFESSFPGSMSVNSPIAFMISIGYFYLVLTLLAHLAMIYGNLERHTGNPYLALEIRRSMRFGLPTIFTIVCICAVIRLL